MTVFRKLNRFPPVPICFISGLFFLVIMGVRSLGTLESIEITAYDWFVRSKPKLLEVKPRILIIQISEEDILAHGRWPLTDATLSEALQKLIKHRPRAIGVDIFRDISIPPGTGELSSILRRNSNIICVTKFGDGGVPPPSVLVGTNQVGFNDMLVDPGGVIRRGLLFLDDGKEVFYAFNLLLALHFLQNSGVVVGSDEKNPEYLQLGQTTIKPLERNDGVYINADARGYQYLIDFKDAENFYQSYSLASLLSEQIDSEQIRDKIVLIRVVSQSVKDHFYTPFSRGFQEDQQMPGVTLHAHLTSQLIRFGLNESSPMRTITEKQEILILLLWSLLGGIIGYFVRSPWWFSMMLAGGLSLVWGIAYSAFVNGWWIPIIPPALSWFLCAGVTTAFIASREKKKRAFLMKLFSKHVSREIADSVWEQRDQFLYKGRPKARKMTVTILFSDIRGFTTVSEILEPSELIHWLNMYMEAMTKIVMVHGGVIDDYAGDGIKANFGVPFPRKTILEIGKDAINAVNCAIAMGKEVEKLNAVWQSKALPKAGIRIGIFTGSVVAGALGSSERMKYTTVGDIVNIAARLESYDKDFARNNFWRILIGETTLNYLEGLFNTEMIGETDLKGKNEKISIYRVLSKKDKRIR